MWRVDRGFSLLEILTVMAVVGILIVTALPVWKRSQVQSAVAQSRADLLEIQSAIDAFFLDYQFYPEDHDNVPAPGMSGLFRLTTPIPYLNPDLPLIDPFSLASPNGPFNYEGGGGCPGNQPARPIPDYRLVTCVPAYLMVALGPDRSDSTFLNDDFPFGTRIASYSPTNGIESFGDLYRITGSYAQGDFLLDGVQIGGGNKR